MSKFIAIATFIGVGVLSLFGMSQSVFASVIYTQPVIEGYVTGIAEGFEAEAKSALQGQTITHITVNLKPTGISDNFNFTIYSDDCGSYSPHNFLYSDYGVDYLATTTSFYVTFPYSFTFPEDMSFCIINADASYPMKLGVISSGSIIAVSYCDSIYCPLNGESSNPPDSDLTRFISISPGYGSVFASTSSTFLASSTVSFYISPDDFVSGHTFIHGSLISNAGVNLLPGISSNSYTLLSSDIDSSGTFSTTSSVLVPSSQYGAARVIWDIKYPSGSCFLGICFGFTTVSTSTVFGLGTTTVADLLAASTTGSWQAVLDSAASSSQTLVNVLDNCAPFTSHFNVVLCVVSLIVPSYDTIQKDLDSLRTLAPWGYAFRVYDIFSSGLSERPPSISMPIPGTHESLDLTPWDMLFATSTILGSASASFEVNGISLGSGYTLRQITEPYWNFIWFLLLGLAIIRSVTGFGSGYLTRISKDK